jgi:hypothetical protein
MRLALTFLVLLTLTGCSTCPSTPPMYEETHG